jgi:hypothetical protein
MTPVTARPEFDALVDLDPLLARFEEEEEAWEGDSDDDNWNDDDDEEWDDDEDWDEEDDEDWDEEDWEEDTEVEDEA